MGKALDKKLITDVVLNYVRAGLTVERACLAAGVGVRTFRTWRKENQPLSAALKKAESDFERTHIQNISTHGADDWKASAWLLERKFPERYAKRVVTIEPKETEGGVLVKVPKPKGGDSV